MKIYHHLNNFTKLNHAIVTIGTFDGVHLGHQKIIKRMTELAKSTRGETVILTFFPHPRMVVDPENQQLKMINTIGEKAKILEDLGINHLVITPFTRDFSNLSPTDYIKNILIDQIGTKHIIVGYDHRFGKNRSGTMIDLQNLSKQYGFIVEEIAKQDIDDVAVSSTKIRTALLKGNVSLAKDYLGYYFSINGLVIKGDKIGRAIGFPTANLFVDETNKLIPCDGIYAATIETDSVCLNAKLHSENFKQRYKGMAYIGKRPTINGMRRNIEVNIFNFNKEIYGQTLKINFMKFLRPDIKFATLEILTAQLHQDKTDALSFFNSIEK